MQQSTRSTRVPQLPGTDGQRRGHVLALRRRVGRRRAANDAAAGPAVAASEAGLDMGRWINEGGRVAAARG